ncbi:MAG: ABC transporter substrate-binding protein [Gemmatimonadales bacterium]
MPLRAWSILALVLAIASCQVRWPRAVVALAYPADGGIYAAIANSLAGTRPATRRIPTLLVDTSEVRQTADAMVDWAQRVVGMPKVVAVIGPGNSQAALASAPVYNAAGIPQVVPMVTDRLIQASGPWTFTMAPDDSVEAAFLVRYVARVVRARRVTLFYDNDAFGQSLRESLVRECNARGIRVLTQVAVLPSSDFELLLSAALGAGRPDALLMATRALEVGTVASLAAGRLPRVPVIAADGALVPDRLVRLAGSGLANIRAVAFWVPDTTDPQQQAFIAAARRVSGHDPDSDVAMTEDAIALLSAAIDEVGPDRAAIRNWLRSLGRERPAFAGLTGPISFGPAQAHSLTMVRVGPDGRITRDSRQ